MNDNDPQKFSTDPYDPDVMAEREARGIMYPGYGAGLPEQEGWRGAPVVPQSRPTEIYEDPDPQRIRQIGELNIMDSRTLGLIEASTELITEALGCLRRETETSRESVTTAAAECQASWDQLKDDPESRAKLDASHSWCTSLGLKHMAQMFRESAASYDEKLAAIEELTEALENQEG